MEIKNLISFLHVAELNSFTKAGQRLGYSQSTISFQIKQLEEELDCLLFERINNTITLTAKGKELFSYAQRVIALTAEFKQNLGEDQDLRADIHVVLPDSICEILMQDYGEFHQRYPYISLKFSTADTDDMFRILSHNEADVVLTLDQHTYQKEFVIMKEKRIDMHFVTSSASPLAKRKNIHVNELVDYPFVLTEKAMGYRKGFDEALAKRSIEIQPILEISRPDIITKVLEQTQSISFLPDFVTREMVEQGKLVYLDVIDFEIEIWKQLIHHRNKWISRPLQEFLDYIIEKEFN